jgi:transcriptional regulator with PAS, ATPase and Fis domain
MPSSILFHVPPTTLAPHPEPATVPVTGAGLSLDDHLEKVEASLIDWALAASGGNKSKAAELLLISRSTLGDRIRRLRRNSGSTPAEMEANPSIS